MITFSETARNKLLGHLQARPEEALAIRLSIIGRNKDSFRYDFRTVYRTDVRAGDSVIDMDGFMLYVDAETLPNIEGASLNLGEDGSFKIENPNPVWADDFGPRVLEIIDTKINPAIALHGGNVTLVDVQGTTAYIAFGGGCVGCGLANVTLKEGVHKMIREAVPELIEVVDMTEHALGVNPYFKPGMAGRTAVGETGATG
jgi:Fe/S biogenesis protein NfuA